MNGTIVKKIYLKILHGGINMDYQEILKYPNILIAGSTGSGKSVLLNNIMYTIIKDNTYKDVKYYLIDVKRVELSDYSQLKKYCLGFARTPCEALTVLNSALNEIYKRYKIMEKKHVKKYTGTKIYIVIDELAELLTSKEKNKIIETLQRILQICRASNITVLACTQFPKADILPSKLKVNFSVILGLRVNTKSQSRVILDTTGLESLPLCGYCIVSAPQKFQLLKINMIPENEINKLLEYRKNENKIIIKKYLKGLIERGK